MSCEIIYVGHSSNRDDIKIWMKPITEETDVQPKENKKSNLFRIYSYIN